MAAPGARAAWRVLPAAATVLLVCVPAWGGGRVTPADLASVLLVCAGAVAAARGARPPALTRLAAVLFGAPVVAFAVATAAAGDPAGALTGFLRHSQVFVLVPLALVLLLRSHRDARLVAGCVVAVALAQGTLGVLQYATGTGASYMGQDIRAVGGFGPQHVMGMATVVSYGLIVALCLGLAPPPRAAGRWWRPAALGCAALLAVPLAVSFSRGAWLATGCAALAVLAPAALRAGRRLLARRPSRRVALALCAGALVAGGSTAGLVATGSAGTGLVAERLGSIGEVSGTPDQSVTDRYAMWSAAVAMWRAEPLTGVGPRGFADHRDSHASLALSGGSDTGGAGAAFQRQELESPHNMYLLLLAEQGLLGAATVVGCWGALLAACAARLRRAGAGERGVGLAATGLLVWQAVNFLYADIGGPTTVLTAVALGLAAWWALSPAALREARA